MTFFDRLLIGEKLSYDIPRGEQELYLNNIGSPVDDYDRSFKQYKGQMIYMSSSKRILLNTAAAITLPFLMFYLMFCGLILRKGSKLEAIGRLKEWHQFIPQSLLLKYEIDRKSWWKDPSAIHFSDISFVLRFLTKYLVHPYFVVKTIYKMAKYSALIYKHNPKAIIVHDEFSFTSSILTLFCQMHHVKHIDVMHGEKLYDLRDSFFRFDECFIWDEHYKDLFISLKAEPSQFIIELPLSMKFNTADYFDEKLYADFKYYLAEYDENELSSIVKSLEFAKKQGLSVKYRPHPNYSDLTLLKKYVPESQIELSSVNILSSVSSLQYAVGVDTTVLSQAYFNGKDVVIDDITFKKRVDVLKDLDYILIDKTSNRLSKMQC